MRILLLLFMTLTAVAQEPFSQRFFEVKQYSQEDNQAIVKKFHGLRVTDVVDGLDMAGLQDVTVMDPQIGPLWRDEQQFKHRIYGVALTLRLVPPQERAPIASSRAEFDKWKGDWTRRLLPKGLAAQIRPDTILVIDASRTKDVGFCGSNNTLNWVANGLRGVVTDGGCRDSDEMILERIPVYLRDSTRGWNQGRVAIESYNTPVNVGGVLVLPGDIIVADTDGVAVVPRAKAEVVAAGAHSIQDGDTKARRRIYDKLKRQPDFTVK